MEIFLLGGGLATENYEAMPGWHDCRTVPNLSVSCSLSYIHLFQSLSFSAWVSVTLCSDQDCLQHLLEQSLMMPSLPILSQSSIICPSLRISPSAVSISPSAFSRLAFPSSCSLFHLLLPTPSFSIHILEDIYERVCICTIFSAEETYIFSSSLPLSPSSSLSS